ncbi:Rubredoxin-like superfamily protein [Striga hermonthica]|uniref:Rubredoxin-like superfamily protein n=1 Tax=Striga hermonthica TaxID=68872 RepID=A0A9N7RFF6_STRHE|nr:Rubredoxin-like superfamily protein [Striga hermonthica]
MALASTSFHGAKSIAPPVTAAGATALRLPADRFALRSSFFSPSIRQLMPPPSQVLSVPATAPKFSMRLASKQAYICRDCGYIYNDRTPFEKVPDKYFCPVCGAPKRRFRPYQPAVTKDANSTEVRKARKAQIKRDESIGQALPFAVALGAAALAALYFYLNSTY